MLLLFLDKKRTEKREWKGKRKLIGSALLLGSGFFSFLGDGTKDVDVDRKGEKLTFFLLCFAFGRMGRVEMGSTRNIFFFVCVYVCACLLCILIGLFSLSLSFSFSTRNPRLCMYLVCIGRCLSSGTVRGHDVAAGHYRSLQQSTTTTMDREERKRNCLLPPSGDDRWYQTRGTRPTDHSDDARQRNGNGS
jgi:hypothetical protein